MQPWSYDADAYAATLASCAGRDLPHVRAIGPAGQGTLENALATGGREIPEELVIDELLRGLPGGASR